MWKGRLIEVWKKNAHLIILIYNPVMNAFYEIVLPQHKSGFSFTNCKLIAFYSHIDT